ncbi:MAG: GNAT family N-acetyltransferase [Aliarcobacter butzleri]|uniref:GNAT family N-acetyltransferase n=1 Tax=Aliarcobacter butzleri TaxID=28197 RepID=UPI002A4657B3|nr:GNAT family N-acetyltransferase [Aliarcobacter butzleri]
MICKNIEEVRNNINNIDEQIVKLIALRGRFVKQAAKFKKDSNEVKAPKRVEEVINKVKNIARLNGANEKVVENVYRTMIDSFINDEIKEFEYQKNQNEKFQWFYDSVKIDWNELSNLYKIAPLGDKNTNDLKIAFGNSKYKCFVYDNQKLIGVGRSIADGIDVSYICDVAIHPDYQKQGLGKKIVNKLLEFSEGYNKIILFTSMGKEPFYAKLGFDKMNTAMAIFKNRQRVLDMGLISEFKS